MGGLSGSGGFRRWVEKTAHDLKQLNSPKETMINDLILSGTTFSLRPSNVGVMTHSVPFPSITPFPHAWRFTTGDVNYTPPGA